MVIGGGYSSAQALDAAANQNTRQGRGQDQEADESETGHPSGFSSPSISTIILALVRLNLLLAAIRDEPGRVTATAVESPSLGTIGRGFFIGIA